MYDLSKLHGRIIEKFGTQKAFAEAVGCTQTHVSHILNGKAYLDQRETTAWMDILDISANDAGAYFLTLKI